MYNQNIEMIYLATEVHRNGVFHKVVKITVK